ncbi:MAG: FHA domain-containing protein [Acidobacteriota bacterium]
MNAFATIAARYGVDPTDEEAVDRFFDERAPSLPAEEREAILAELMTADGIGLSNRRRRYATSSDDVNFRNDPAVEVPWGAVNPRTSVAAAAPLDDSEARRSPRNESATAKLFFVGLDGGEKSYRLQNHRSFTIGRDPSNDIILRDPKVGSHHAEIVFERGFFVLHDLASANGTYVNGRRVRVAPLTHGCRLCLGNTYGRFSEELSTENAASAVAEPFELPLPDDGYAHINLNPQRREPLPADQPKKK